MRRMITFAAAGAILAIAAISANSAAANVRRSSTRFAGYQVQAGGFTGSSTTTVGAKFKVPELSPCGAVESGIHPDVGLYNGTNAGQTASTAGMFIFCKNGKAHYYPMLSVNGHESDYPAAKARPGDTIIAHVSHSSSKTSVSVVDKTRNFKRSAHGAGSSETNSPWIGVDPLFEHDNLLRVPNFGSLRFRRCVGVKSGGFAARFNRRTSGGTLQIKTGAFPNSTKAFSTVFKHS
jgi:hypothetical protein